MTAAEKHCSKITKCQKNVKAEEDIRFRLDTIEKTQRNSKLSKMKITKIKSVDFGRSLEQL